MTYLNVDDKTKPRMMSSKNQIANNIFDHPELILIMCFFIKPSTQFTDHSFLVRVKAQVDVLV